MRNMPMTVKKFSSEEMHDFIATEEARFYSDGESTCRTCGGSGVAIFCKNGRIFHKVCDCRGVKEALTLANFTSEQAKNTLDSFKTNELFRATLKSRAVEYCQYLESGGKSWFYLAGQSGCGKTHLATGIVRRIVESGVKEGRKVTALYAPWSRIVSEYESTRFDSNARNTLVRKIVEAPDILVIDDFLQELVLGSKPVLDCAFNIINARYSTGKNTIILSELPEKTIREHSEAIAGRIFEACKRENFVTAVGRKPERNYRYTGGTEI